MCVYIVVYIYIYLTVVPLFLISKEFIKGTKDNTMNTECLSLPLRSRTLLGSLKPFYPHGDY